MPQLTLGGDEGEQVEAYADPVPAEGRARARHPEGGDEAAQAGPSLDHRELWLFGEAAKAKVPHGRADCAVIR